MMRDQDMRARGFHIYTVLQKMFSIDGAICCQSIQVEYVCNTGQAPEEASTVLSWGRWD